MQGAPDKPDADGKEKQVWRPCAKRRKTTAYAMCQFCGKNLDVAGGAYHKRCRICPTHMTAPALEVDGCMQRFCQQCGQFHTLDLFDGDRRSCREQLAKQALRRRLARHAAANQEEQQRLARRAAAEQALQHLLARLAAAIQAAEQSYCNSGSSRPNCAAATPQPLQLPQAEQLYAAVEARAAAAVAASSPKPSVAGALLQRMGTLAEQMIALLQQQPPQPQQQQTARPLRPQPLASTCGQQLQAPALPAQQQLLQAYGSNHSGHCMPAQDRATSPGTSAASPLAPLTPPNFDSEAAAVLQQATTALLPAFSQPGMVPVLQALLQLMTPQG